MPLPSKRQSPTVEMAVAVTCCQGIGCRLSLQLPLPTVAATAASLALSMYSKACAFLAQAAGYTGAHVLQNAKVEKGDSCACQCSVPRARCTVQEVWGMLGEIYFRLAYRMPYELFWKLHSILATRITAARLKACQYLPKGGRIGLRGGKYKLPPIRNGHISTSVHLACALQYFAGGSPMASLTPM